MNQTLTTILCLRSFSCVHQNLCLDIPNRLAIRSLWRAQILFQDMLQICGVLEVCYHDHFIHGFNYWPSHLTVSKKKEPWASVAQKTISTIDRVLKCKYIYCFWQKLVNCNVYYVNWKLNCLERYKFFLPFSEWLFHIAVSNPLSLSLHSCAVYLHFTNDFLCQVGQK